MLLARSGGSGFAADISFDAIIDERSIFYVINAFLNIFFSALLNSSGTG